jgi:hypothetical protein
MENYEGIKQAEGHLKLAEADLVAMQAAERAAEDEIEEAVQELRGTVTIIVNGVPHAWPKGKITYAQAVTLEVPDYSKHPEITYSVKYKGGHGDKPEGILSPGSSVKVKEGMSFSVSETGQS